MNAYYMSAIYIYLNMKNYSIQSFRVKIISVQLANSKVTLIQKAPREILYVNR